MGLTRFHAEAVFPDCARGRIPRAERLGVRWHMSGLRWRREHRQVRAPNTESDCYAVLHDGKIVGRIIEVALSSNEQPRRSGSPVKERDTRLISKPSHYATFATQAARQHQEKLVRNVGFRMQPGAAV